MKRKKIIGIIGGMGEEATINLYYTIVDICKKKLKAKTYEDYPEMVFYTYPMPENLINYKNRKKMLSIIKNIIKKFEKIGVDFVLMDCGTLYQFEDELRRYSKIEIFDFIDYVINESFKKDYKKIGLVSWMPSKLKKYYELKGKKHGIEIITMNKADEKYINSYINNFLAGGKINKNNSKLVKAMKDLEKRSDAIVLGCTELPLIINSKLIKKPIFNITNILAKSAIKRYRGR